MNFHGINFKYKAYPLRFIFEYNTKVITTHFISISTLFSTIFSLTVVFLSNSKSLPEANDIEEEKKYNIKTIYFHIRLGHVSCSL